MPTNEQLQRKIAEVLGWKNLHLKHGNLLGFPPGFRTIQCVPNWPTNRDDSKELPVKDQHAYNEAISKECYKAIKTGDPTSEIILSRQPAEVESLAWLLYKGWRWVECDECDGLGDKRPDFEIGQLCLCNGKGGEWEKV